MEIKTSITPKSRDEFLAALKEYADGMHKDMHDALIEQSALVCRDAITFTPPMLPGGGGGNSTKAKKLGELSVYWDISAVFGTPQKEKSSFMFFRSLVGALYSGDRGMFAKLMQRKQVTKVKNGIFKKIVADADTNRAFGKMKNLLAKYVPDASYTPEAVVTDIETIHRRLLETNNGRKLRDKANLGLNPAYQYVVDSKERLVSYIKAQQTHVGRLKAGWAGAIRNLPPMKGKSVKNPGGKINSWITRHNSSAGYSSSNLSNREQMSIKVGNAIGDNNNVATDADTPNLVYGNRVKQMHLRMERYLIARANKFNKQN